METLETLAIIDTTRIPQLYHLYIKR